MTLRAFLFTLVADDPEMNSLGYTLANGYAGEAPDSPPGDLFWVLRWGNDSPGVAGARGRSRVTQRTATLWAYDRQPNFDRINSCLKRWMALMDALEASSTGSGPYDGWVTATNWEGETSDGYDDVYTAQYRTSSYTIVASGD